MLRHTFRVRTQLSEVSFVDFYVGYGVRVTLHQVSFHPEPSPACFWSHIHYYVPPLIDLHSYI